MVLRVLVWPYLMWRYAVLPSMPSSFAAMQVAWAEDDLKLFGCRQAKAEPWRMFLFNITADVWESGETDLLSTGTSAQKEAMMRVAKAMTRRMTAWQASVELSQTERETNCSSKWVIR